MHILDHIDTVKTVTVSPLDGRDSSHRLREHADGAVTLPASAFMLWLAVTPVWKRVFYRNLHLVSATSEQPNLLSTWLDRGSFQAMLAAARGNPTFDLLSEQTAPWQGHVVDVRFDFFAKG